MVKKKTFKFPKRKVYDRIPARIPKLTKDIEGLTGFVRGFTASDIEERFARALIRMEIGFWFQYKLKTATSLPDQERKVDFIVFHRPGKTVPVEIYGDRWHSTEADRNMDRARAIEIDKEGKKNDWEKLLVAWGHELTDQHAADQIARRMFL